MITANFYGKIQILEMEIEGYVLSDGTACLSERGAANLLGFRTPAGLYNVFTNSAPKELEPFINKDLTRTQTLVQVTANCQQRNSNIKVCTAKMINTIARAYAVAYLQGKLRKNQIHIGLQCATLRNALADVALEQMIYDYCGYQSKEPFSQRVESTYMHVIKVIQEMGFTCSIPNNIATKKDIASFLKTPESTINSFLRKSKIKPILLDRNTIKNLGSTAPRLYGYPIEDAAKIVIGIDTSIGIEIKKRLFGDIVNFANMQAKDEIQWHNELRRTFDGLGLYHNYQIDHYRVDFFIQDLKLVLECNGYQHKYYDPEKESIREKVITQKYGYKLVRFHHKISWQALMNAILKVKLGQVITVYDPADIVK